MKLAILKAWHPTYQNYIKACEDLGVEYEVVDIMTDKWIESIIKGNFDGVLLRPSYFKQYWKDMYDERVYFIEKHLNLPIYPSYDEIFIYENKNNMEYWLKIHKIKHAETHIFYKKDEALEFLKTAKFPLVFKTKIGAAGLGVKFINNKRQAKRLIKRMFPFQYFFARGFTKWFKHKKIKFLSIPLLDDKQYGFVMFQEKIENIKCEWRMIKVGESYFGHQKLEAKNGKHSGSNLVGWVKPPLELLNWIKEICDIGNFSSMDIDIFENEKGEYFVNELQTMFGSFDNSQMYIDGVPGRYKYDKNTNEWLFEEGYFNVNASMNLRVEDFINKLKDGNYEK